MRIAIVKLSAMGDIIHSMIILQFLHRKFPGIEIDWVIEAVFAPLLNDHSQIHEVIALPIKKIKKEKNFALLKESYHTLKSRGSYDAVLDLQGNIKSAIVARVLSNSVIGYDKNSLREKPATWFYKKQFAVAYDMNVIWRAIALIEKQFEMQLEIECILEKEPLLYFNSAAYSKAMTLWGEQDKKILFFVGASWPSKIYPFAQMIEVIKGLNREVMIVWGSEEEELFALRMQEALPDLVSLMPKLSISELIAVVSMSDITIGGDTGPVHIAWAQNRASVTIFGPTPSFRNTFITPTNKVVDTGKTIDSFNLDREDFSINTIKPTRIIAHIESLIGA
jgi:heptosyltransferase I